MTSLNRSFCSNTSIHGFPYLLQSRNIVERLFWLAVIVAAFAGSVVVIVQTVAFWVQNPTLTTAETYSLSVRYVQVIDRMCHKIKCLVIILRTRYV